MKKILFILPILVLSIFLTGCTDDIYDYVEDAEQLLYNDIDCNADSQYLDSIGFAYYVEGSCVNNGSKDYDYFQVEYICYDSTGNNLGTAIANTNNFLDGQTWKFKAIALVNDEEQIDHCDFQEVSGW